MKTLIVSLVSLFIFSSVILSENNAVQPNTTINSDNSFVLNGTVIDKNTKESLAGVVVIANGKKVYTDLDGHFSITNICNGNCKVNVKLISYQDQVIDVDMSKNQDLQISLQAR
jgi:hypothetical protein